MAEKKEISKEILGLKKEIEEGKIVIGKEAVLKNLKDNKLEKIYFANNCPEKMKGEINYYQGLVKIPAAVLEISNEELGVLCKKHFFISVLGVKKK